MTSGLMVMPYLVDKVTEIKQGTKPTELGASSASIFLDTQYTSVVYGGLVKELCVREKKKDNFE